MEEANKILIDKKEERDRVSKVWHGQGQDEREVEEANKILIDKKEEMDRVSKVWHGQGQDEERGGGGQQDPHR